MTELVCLVVDDLARCKLVCAQKIISSKMRANSYDPRAGVWWINTCASWDRSDQPERAN